MSDKKYSSAFYNIQAKVICFLLAVFVYFVFTYSLVSTRTVTVPVNIIMPENYTAVSLIPDTVDVKIRGTEDRIYMIDVTKISVSVDFSDVNTEGVASAPVVFDLGGMDNLFDFAKISFSSDPANIKIYFESSR